MLHTFYWHVQEVKSGIMHGACQQAKTTMLAEPNGVDLTVDFVYQLTKKTAAMVMRDRQHLKPWML